jgi:short-subunit dehydrogenase
LGNAAGLPVEFSLYGSFETGIFASGFSPLVWILVCQSSRKQRLFCGKYRLHPFEENLTWWGYIKQYPEVSLSTSSQQHFKEFRQKYGPWALVAGASEGLGAAYAEALATRGLDLVLVARRLELLQTLAARLTGAYGVQVRLLQLDLAQPDAASQIARETQSLEVGLLVYNAAFSAVGAFLERSLDEHLLEIDTNVRTPLTLLNHFGPRMLTQGHGGLILMTSLSAFQGSAYVANYSASKAYNVILAEGLWEEWRRGGVDVLACIAGSTRTPNYLASFPRPNGSFTDATLEPQVVVAEALAALGRHPTVIPGRVNRLSSFVMRRLLSRRAAVRIMGYVLRGMYGNNHIVPKEAIQ